MVSRSADKAQENKDIQEYEQKGQIIYLNKDLGQVCSIPGWDVMSWVTAKQMH